MLPSALESIGSGAFEGCPVQELTLPAGVTSVPSDAFLDTDDPLWVHAAQSDAALALLRDGIDVDAGTVRRALIVAQTYPGTRWELTGPVGDERAMTGLLTHLARTGYQVTVLHNLSADGIAAGIRSVFQDAGDYDISLFYYSGHGVEGGCLMGIGGTEDTLAPARLRGILDTVPGRKVLIVDACFSGALIGNDRVTDAAGLPQTPAGFNAGLLSAFSGKRLRSAGGQTGRYYIMTAASAAEYSEENDISVDYGGVTGTGAFGLFTYSLCRGSGWEAVHARRVSPQADTDENGVVSFAEAFRFAKINAAIMNPYQNAQSNCPDETAFSPFR